MPENPANLKNHPAHPRSTVRPRPAMFRALGHNEPPQQVVIEDQVYDKIRVFKHDSWAATALYENATTGKVICKFNRSQSIGPIPMHWLGRLLARNESQSLQKLQDTGHVPILLNGLTANGRHQPNAVARIFIEGHPLGHKEQVPASFFPVLQELLRTMHDRHMAYVDLHKRENVLVGDDGQPYLIDFQICYQPSRISRILPTTLFLLSILQRSDDYHLEKLRRKSSPNFDPNSAPVPRPWWIRLHRSVAMPFRQLRRKFFVVMKVRSGEGKVHTEFFTEEALREEVTH